jgi:4-alpha-glucanotransferase
VAVPEDRRGHLDRVADAALDGPAPAVEHRPDILDLDPRRRIISLRKGHRPTSVPVDRAAIRQSRSAGILLHPTSLPSGKLGDDAFRFVDWLAAAGQTWWQILPLGPPDEHRSPYKAASAFAAWRGLLADPHAEVTTAEVESFVARHPYWTGDWAAFAGDGAIADQVRFEREWGAVRAYAAARGVRLLGDVPIYVAQGGADHRARPELFQRGAVAGAPPDALSRTGQLWGNPLYDWHAARAEGYRWWIERFRRTFELVDAVRIDHFRGFVSYWAVPERAATASAGRWRPGPGADLFRTVERTLGKLPLVAENLGRITPPVERLRSELGYPGMAVLQFAYEGAPNEHHPRNVRANTVIYTGTHDTDTVVGWWSALDGEARARTGFDAREPQWSAIDAASRSRARVAIAQAQDVLGLGSDARMNRPGEEEGNWRWRLEQGQLTEEVAARLRAVTESAGRAAAKPGRATDPSNARPSRRRARRWDGRT